MASEIENAAQDETEEVEQDPTAEAVGEVRDFRAENALTALVSNVIAMAQAKPSRFSSIRKVCRRIVADMKETSYEYIIWDLKERHSRKVADLFGCDVSEVREEFVRLLDENEAEETYQWKDYTSNIDPKIRSIVKPFDYRKKDSHVKFEKDAILDDLVYKEVNWGGCVANGKKEIYAQRKIVIDRILQNLVDDKISIDKLKDRHYQKVSNLYDRPESEIREEFRQQNENLVIEEKEKVDAYLLAKKACKIFEGNKRLSDQVIIRLFFRNLEIYGKKFRKMDYFEFSGLDKYWDREEVLEEYNNWKNEFKEIRKEDIMDILVRQNIRTSSYGNRGIPRKSLTKNKFFARLRQKIEERDLTVSHLKQRHFEEISKFLKCDISEVMEDLFGAPEALVLENEFENNVPPPQIPEFSVPELAQNQDVYQEEPAAKRAKYDPESESQGAEDDPESGIQEVDYDDFEPEEEEYQMEDDDEAMDYDEGQDPEFQDQNDQNGHGEAGSSWEYENGSPAPSESEDPDHEEMEDGLEDQEDSEFQDPDVQGLQGAYGPSWDDVDDVLAPEDEEPAQDEPEHEEMEVVQEEEPQASMSDEQRLMQVYIDMICDFAVSNENTSLDFKQKTLLRELYNFLVDDNLSVDLTGGQFEKIATSFDGEQESIEELFAFFEREKKFLDNLDRGVFEDPRITEIIDNIMGDVKPSIENLDDEIFLKERLEILESFYKITVENGIEIRMISRQKRHLAAYLGLSVTETMDHLMEWELRDRPKNAPAPNKKVREPKANRVSLAIAKEELFFGSISELEPGETVADREAAVKFVNSSLKKIIEENDPRLKKYFKKYRETLKTKKKFEYDNALGKVTELFRTANGHISKRMSHPVQEAYRTAFLILLYEEIGRELTTKELQRIGEWMKMKDYVDYIKRKEKQFFETGRIEMDEV